MKEGQKFLDALARASPVLFKNARATCRSRPADAAWLLDPLARWSEEAFGESIFDQSAQGYKRYCLTVAEAQRDYEATGIYNPRSLAGIREDIYEDPEYMIPYMWAAVLIYSFWPSMIGHLRVLREDFFEALPPDPQVLELGCGHGVLGLLAAEHRPDAHVTGLDLSPAAVAIAHKLRAASGHGPRVHVAVQDATLLPQSTDGPGTYQGIILAMLAEHLEDPESLLFVAKRNVSRDGLVFFSTAIQSPQPDHVYEFGSESQVMRLAEKVGLRARQMVSAGQRIAPGAKYRPRAAAMVLEHL
jgi:2-polyprenyl-3-methyl-5-hydroxy-6-metoxy-1,4-benzoquinol methylase